MKPIRLLALPLFLLLATCKPAAEAPGAGAVAAPAGVLGRVVGTAPSGEARSIGEVKASAKPGEEVTLKGRVMGNLKPFVDGRAAFILADPAVIAACSDNPSDQCETPWDSCCHTPEEKKKAIVTIQVVGDDGRVLKQGIEGVGGVAKLATLTVTGKVAEGSQGDTLIINATAIQAGR